MRWLQRFKLPGRGKREGIRVTAARRFFSSPFSFKHRRYDPFSKLVKDIEK
jgi:hypothetical protein